MLSPYEGFAFRARTFVGLGLGVEAANGKFCCTCQWFDSLMSASSALFGPSLQNPYCIYPKTRVEHVKLEAGLVSQLISMCSCR